jgi:hypothetical protein
MFAGVFVCRQKRCIFRRQTLSQSADMIS